MMLEFPNIVSMVGIAGIIIGLSSFIITRQLREARRKEKEATKF